MPADRDVGSTEDTAEPQVHPIVDATAKKSGLLWVGVDQAPARAVWHIWHDGSAYVLTGEGEQQLPGIENAREATVTVRGDKGGRAVTWRAAVSTVDVDAQLWAQLVPELMAKRLNLPDGERAPERWRRTGRLTRLAPVGAPVEAGDTLPAQSLAEPPRPTEATTPTRLPYVLGRGRAARRRRRATRGTDS